jgi:hypothetical protein
MGGLALEEWAHLPLRCLVVLRTMQHPIRGSSSDWFLKELQQSLSNKRLTNQSVNLRSPGGFLV